MWRVWKMSEKFPLKLKAEQFSKGFKIHVEIEMNHVDPYHLEMLENKDSELRQAIRKFEKMIIEETGSQPLNKVI